MNWKNKIWKYATALVTLILIMNPEMIELAILIDAIGLETFFLLIEVQLLALSSYLFQTTIKPTVNFLKNSLRCFLILPSWNQIKENPSIISFASPSAASFMCLLVTCYFISIFSLPSTVF
ncbi:MAG: hypothetical protein ACRBHB_05965 [Arenicella sp.]